MTAVLQALAMTFPRATISVTDSAVSTANTSSYSFASLAIGAPSPNRQVPVGIGSQRGTTGGTVSAVMIGGIAASFIARVNNTAEYVEMWSAPVPTGTTATVEVTWTTAQANTGVAVAALYGARLTAADTKTDTTGNPSTELLAVPANGAAFCYTFQRSNTNASFSFTNLTDAGIGNVVENASASHGAASTHYIAPQSALAVSATSSQAGVRDPVTIFASWGPL